MRAVCVTQANERAMPENDLSGLNIVLRGSVCGREILDRPWADTAIGAIRTWPASLSTLVMMMLACPKPMLLAWGPELVVLFNDAYRPLLGDRATGAMGQPFRLLWAPIWDDIGSLIAATLEGESRRMLDLQHDLHWNNVADDRRPTITYSPVRDETGAIAGLLCMVDDIAPSLVARNAPRRDEAPQADRAAGVNIGTWDWDVVADRVTANARFASLYGLAPSRAAAGAPVAEFFAGIHPDDLPRVRLEVAEAMRSGAVFTSVYRLIGEVGVTRWVCAQGRGMFDRDGKCVRFPGVSIDITERIEADSWG